MRYLARRPTRGLPHDPRVTDCPADTYQAGCLGTHVVAEGREVALGNAVVTARRATNTGSKRADYDRGFRNCGNSVGRHAGFPRYRCGEPDENPY
jgi:hypothetical protein